MIPAAFAIGRYFPSTAALNAVLIVDAARWTDGTVASVFSPAFARAARLALRFKLHCLGFVTPDNYIQQGAPKQRATA